jgi:hypothetical protein
MINAPVATLADVQPESASELFTIGYPMDDGRLTLLPKVLNIPAKYACLQTYIHT